MRNAPDEAHRRRRGDTRAAVFPAIAMPWPLRQLAPTAHRCRRRSPTTRRGGRRYGEEGPRGALRPEHSPHAPACRRRIKGRPSRPYGQAVEGAARQRCHAGRGCRPASRPTKQAPKRVRRAGGGNAPGRSSPPECLPQPAPLRLHQGADGHPEPGLRRPSSPLNCRTANVRTRAAMPSALLRLFGFKSARACHGEPAAAPTPDTRHCRTTVASSPTRPSSPTR